MERARRTELTLLLDLDGTLIPFASTPEQAVLDAAGAELLDGLARAGVRVVIVTGRPRMLVEDIRTRVPCAWIVAEHGAWRAAQGDWIDPPEPARELDSLVAALQPIADAPGIRFERKSKSVCVHWRQVTDERRDSLISAVELYCDEWLEMRPEYERIEGVAVTEVRRRSVHKGIAVHWVRQRAPAAYLLAIGDDYTDEDMFAALLGDEIAIGVDRSRPRMSRARAWLSNPPAVRAFLGWIIETRASGVDRSPPLEHVETPTADHVRTRLNEARRPFS